MSFGDPQDPRPHLQVDQLDHATARAACSVLSGSQYRMVGLVTVHACVF